MQAIDMQIMCGETDRDDDELLELFRNRREKIDDTVMVRYEEGGTVWLLRKDDLHRMQKQREDMGRAAGIWAGVTVGVAAAGCIIAGVGTPWAGMVLAALWGGWLLRNVPREVAG